MIQVICHSLDVHSNTVIHEWPDETPDGVVEAFITFEVDQDHSSSHVYYRRNIDASLISDQAVRAEAATESL